MTTIAYDPVSSTLAADRQTTIGDTGLQIGGDKIMPVRLGERRMLVGLAGIPADAVQLLYHFLHEARTLGFLPVRPPPNDDATGSILIVEFLGGGKRRVIHMGRYGTETDVSSRPWALGSGSDFAIGAMEAGADAERAIGIANRNNIYSGHGIQVEDLHKWDDAPAQWFHPFKPGSPADFGPNRALAVAAVPDHIAQRKQTNPVFRESFSFEVGTIAGPIIHERMPDTGSGNPAED